MATRGKEAFHKRQKELARKNKQKLKEERRAQRKLDKSDPRTGFSETGESNS